MGHKTWKTGRLSKQVSNHYKPNINHLKHRSIILYTSFSVVAEPPKRVQDKRIDRKNSNNVGTKRTDRVEIRQHLRPVTKRRTAAHSNPATRSNRRVLFAT